LRSYTFETLYHPTFSRHASEDFLVAELHSKEKIGSEGNLANIPSFLKRITDDFYSRLIPAKSAVTYEFDRNKEFFVGIYGNFSFSLGIDMDSRPQKKEALLFIGASSSFRRWKTKRFAEVAGHLYKKGYKIILGGDGPDLPEVEIFKKHFKYEFKNIVGALDLVELLKQIAGVELIVSNETCVPHMSRALRVQTVVIYNGSHFGRFVPFEDFGTQRTVLHPEIEQNKKSYLQKSNKPLYKSTLSISDITTKRVVDIIDQLIL